MKLRFEQVRKRTRRVRMLVISSDWPFAFVNDGEFPGCGYPTREITGWIFSTYSLPNAKAHIGLRVKCLLCLPTSNQTWNALTTLRNTLKYHIPLISVYPFWSCYMLTDGWTQWYLCAFHRDVSTPRNDRMCHHTSCLSWVIAGVMWWEKLETCSNTA
jgi:hypothetical protein